MNIKKIFKEIFFNEKNEQRKLVKKFERIINKETYNMSMLESISIRVANQEFLLKKYSVDRHLIKYNYGNTIPFKLEKLINHANIDSLASYQKICDREKEIWSLPAMYEFKKVFNEYKCDRKRIEMILEKTVEKELELLGYDISHKKKSSYFKNDFWLMVKVDLILNKLDRKSIKEAMKICEEEKWKLGHDGKSKESLLERIYETPIDERRTHEEQIYFEPIDDKRGYEGTNYFEPLDGTRTHEEQIYFEPLDEKRIQERLINSDVFGTTEMKGDQTFKKRGLKEITEAMNVAVYATVSKEKKTLDRVNRLNANFNRTDKGPTLVVER